MALSKKDMRDRNTRESALTTIERCVEMRSEMLPEFTLIMNSLHTKGIKLFVTDGAEVSFHATEEVKKINSAISWMRQLAADGDLLQKVIRFMNQLETWSMSFTHDPAPANESFAFEPCSSVFCQMVIAMYPMLLTQRRLNPASGPYQNTVTLFRGWYAKKAKDQLLEQLKRQEEGPKLPPQIGTRRETRGLRLFT